MSGEAYMSRRTRSMVLSSVPWLPRIIAGRLIPPENVWTRADDSQVATLDSDSQVRILIGGLNTAGQAKRWADALDALPDVFAASLGVRTEGAISFSADAMPSQQAMWHSPTWSMRQSKQILEHSTHVIMESGTPLMGTRFGRDALREIRTMRDAGVKVAVVLHGSDVRIPSEHEKLYPDSPFGEPLDGLTAALEAKSLQLNKFLDEMDLPEFVSTPDLLTYRPNAIWVPTLYDSALWHRVNRDGESRTGRGGARLIVGHIPSRAALKGSGAIRGALQPLRDQGLIEYREFRGLSPEQVAREVGDLDVLVDQLGMGLYGVSSVEAMAIGVPVVAELGELTRQKIQQLTGIDPPVVEATAATLSEVVAGLASNPELLDQSARRGREYVQQVHSPRNVARQFMKGLPFDSEGDGV